MVQWICLAAALLALSCSSGEVAEKEPNNSFAEAQHIGYSGRVAGVIRSESDVDYYRYSTRSDGQVRISLSPVKGVNHAISVYDANRRLIKQVDDARKSSPEVISNLFLSKGDYYIVVGHGEKDERRGGKKSFYVLEIGSPPDRIGEREPNDSASAANPITVPASVYGYLSPGFNRQNREPQRELREEDWFSFPVEASLELPAIHDIVLTAPAGISAIIELVDAQGRIMARADTEEGSARLKGIGINRTGTYFLCVYARGFSANADDRYLLNITRREFDPGVEIEPNNSFESARETGDSVRGTIYPDNDVDFFYYPSERLQQYRIELTSPPRLNTRLRIFDDSFRQLYQIDNQGAGLPELMPNITHDGPFFISVTASGSDDENTYELTVRTRKIEAGFEIEPNDSVKRAMPLEKEMKGYISYRDDRDYYQLNVAGREKVTVSVRGVSGATLKVSITDNLGFRLRDADVRNDAEVQLSEMIDQKGYLIVESGSAPSDEPYHIRIVK
jgi:hypothetical protein